MRLGATLAIAGHFLSRICTTKRRPSFYFCPPHPTPTMPDQHPSKKTSVAQESRESAAGPRPPALFPPPVSADQWAPAWLTHHWPWRFYRALTAVWSAVGQRILQHHDEVSFQKIGRPCSPPIWTCCMPPATESDIWLAYSPYALSFSVLHPVILLTDCKSSSFSLLCLCFVCNNGVARPHCYLYPLFGAGRFLIQLLHSPYLRRHTQESRPWL